MATAPFTELLAAWSTGDRAARDRLLELCHPELETMAHRALRREGRGFSLQTGDLVGEAYLRLAEGAVVRFRDRSHFYALVGRLLRRVVVDHCRKRRRRKRNEGARPVPLRQAIDAAEPPPLAGEWLLSLDAAVASLEHLDAVAAQVVELRFFAGMSYDEIAEALGIGRATAFRHWRFARAWLNARLVGPAGATGSSRRMITSPPGRR